MRQHHPLPNSWVDQIFARLVVRYGTEWTRKWEGIDMGAVKTDWASVLAGFREQPECIAYALEYLPEKPPTVQQFVAICNRAPARPAAPQLEGPPANPAKVAAIIATLAAPTNQSPIAWAERLRDRERRGERLSTPQRAAWRQAMEASIAPAADEVFGMTPVPDDVMPPGMLADKRANEAKRAALARLSPPSGKNPKRRERSSLPLGSG